ncbi:HNH endonuclease domain-containing protein [soil metagenome]
MNNLNQLPESDEVNATTLARIFDEVTTSYKFLFFLALLDGAERNCFDTSIPLSMKEIVLDMLVLAWYPHVYFRLSFGKQDKIANQLDKTASLAFAKKHSIHPWDKSAIRQMISLGVPDDTLLRFVPYRLIRPFFPETRGMKKDHEVNLRVAELCDQYFTSRKPPPYRFDSSRSKIFFHPAWCTYLKQNLAVVRGWAWWNFLHYMQRCNPNVPAIAGKLSAPPERESLQLQTKFWREVLAATDYRCIYSGELISESDFALDHFIPWSFVVHNQLWNLIPTSTSVNSQKSDRLPSYDYLDAFISAQHDAITRTRAAFSPKIWEGYVGCFITDLGLPDYEALFNRERLQKAYETNMLPMLQLAEANGFEPAWIYSKH